MEFFRNLIRLCRITGPADNKKEFPSQQISYKGKVSNALMLSPYGLYANISSKNSLGLLFTAEGTGDNKICIGYTPQHRPLDLEEDEIALYHPYTESFIKFRNNGDIEVDCNQESPGNIIVNCKEAQINSSVKTTITSPETEVTGNLSLGGNLNVGGSTALGSTVTSNGKDISDTHTHVGSPSAPTGPQSPTGFPV